MPDRAAIVTGASRGIGRAIASMLADEGYALTVTARKPENLEGVVEELRGRGCEVEAVAANLAAEESVHEIVERHRARFGRLDVLVNNAGLGVGATATEHETKFIDMQIAVNLRAPIFFYRACADMLRAAGAEHRQALVVNLSSLAGKSGQPWLSVYAATKAGLIAYTEAMNKELNGDGVKSVALCPGWVDTDMTDFVKGQVSPDQMLRPEDLGEAVRFLLRLSPGAVVPEILFLRPGDSITEL